MFGVSQYQSRHGGELPHPSIIAAALTAGLSGAKQAAALPAETIAITIVLMNLVLMM